MSYSVYHSHQFEDFAHTCIRKFIPKSALQIHKPGFVLIRASCLITVGDVTLSDNGELNGHSNEGNKKAFMKLEDDSAMS